MNMEKENGMCGGGNCSGEGHSHGCGSGMGWGHGYRKFWIVKKILFLVLIGIVFSYGYKLGVLTERAGLAREGGYRTMMGGYGNWQIITAAGVPTTK